MGLEVVFGLWAGAFGFGPDKIVFVTGQKDGEIQLTIDDVA